MSLINDALKRTATLLPSRKRSARHCGHISSLEHGRQSVARLAFWVWVSLLVIVMAGVA